MKQMISKFFALVCFVCIVLLEGVYIVSELIAGPVSSLSLSYGFPPTKTVTVDFAWLIMLIMPQSWCNSSMNHDPCMCERNIYMD